MERRCFVGIVLAVALAGCGAGEGDRSRLAEGSEAVVFHKERGTVMGKSAVDGGWYSLRVGESVYVMSDDGPEGDQFRTVRISPRSGVAVDVDRFRLRPR